MGSRMIPFTVARAVSESIRCVSAVGADVGAIADFKGACSVAV